MTPEDATKRSTTPPTVSSGTSTLFSAGKRDEKPQAKMAHKPMLNITTDGFPGHSAPSTAASSPECDSGSTLFSEDDDDDDLEIPQFAFKARTRKLKLVEQSRKTRSAGNQSP